ncbi:hypothetical protein [uncultured Pluralibacter sp.]|uniref:hypothetical protein n=1 Tax=uncultured Pluralibacter sp. TaxID=1490864 RepID=UPI00260A70C0|nr:hypothetical protein [uncultured Pluralibacter sp.]
MIEAKKIVSRQGDFILLESNGIYCIDVLIPNFYPNSHIDVSKTFILNDIDEKNKNNMDYLIGLAEKIRKEWTKYADREVTNVKIIQ